MFGIKVFENARKTGISANIFKTRLTLRSQSTYSIDDELFGLDDDQVQTKYKQTIEYAKE
uniref:Uncharacterized protein n=1 Tax=Romanomermis culicivorax TaxID=13658 RepID=A0A915IU77_ROMCU